MVSNMEFEGKNVTSAVKKAAKALNIEENKFRYEVISYGSTGIFGLVGAKKAKIRVALKAAKEKKTVERRPEKEAAPNRSAQKPAEARTAPKAEAVPLPVASVPEEAIEMGRTILQKLLNQLTDDATIQVQTDDERVVFHVKGGNSAVLIGKRGQTLEAIQYLVEKIVNKHSEARVRLQVDVAGYLESKKINLEQRANRLADKVKRDGKPVTVGEMNVYDRKIVHMALKNDQQVRTQSMGNGFYRKLVILPRKSGPSKNRQN
ncbi:MAG: Jag N-terminal domain-containing protein [Deltaproteobacteria bacterium]|nr:Jag N-terminal domain-containing protein [Deltaproteobacteria bacterium]